MDSLSAWLSESFMINTDRTAIYVLSDDQMFISGVCALLARVAPCGQGAILDDTREQMLFIDLNHLTHPLFHLVRALTPLSSCYRVVFWTAHQPAHILNFLRVIENASFIHKKASLLETEQAIHQILSGRRFITPQVKHTFMSSNGPGRVSEETFTILDNIMSGVRVKCIAAKLHTADKSVYSKIRQFRDKLSLLRKSDFLSFIHDIS
ncbi:hypothetical protein A9798_00595 [Edwardsiella hoshinae]|uniref:Uncharacterized protein n=2 Tax=Edwardsiella hoshinae TaxID=93378 RepID=A0ABN4STT0_9GAMM|nr:hypothetical protein A9798_00595 [Edwardsiella hoshinae]